MAANPYRDLLKTIASVEKAKTIGEQFVADINRYYQLSKEVRRPSASIKPSSLGGCFRNQYFMLLNEEPDVGKMEKAEDITIQKSGNDCHNRNQYACQDAKNYSIPIVWCDPEEEARRAFTMGIKTIIKKRDGNELLCYNEDYKASFKCDGIILYRDVKYILEIKSEEFYKFNCRINPEPAHEFQAALYCLCFGIDRVMFLYEDRNLTLRKAYDVTISDKFKQEVKDRIEIILAYSTTKKIPPKEKTKCTYCSYKQICKATGETDEYTLEQLREMIGGMSNEQ